MLPGVLQIQHIIRIININLELLLFLKMEINLNLRHKLWVQIILNALRHTYPCFLSSLIIQLPNQRKWITLGLPIRILESFARNCHLEGLR